MLVPLAYMAGVFFLSSLPGSQLRRLGLSALMWDLAHVPLFAGLAWATLWAIQGSVRPRVLWVAAACLAFAVSDELHQMFVPGRFFSWGDLAADSMGIGVGIAVVLWGWPSLISGGGKPTA
jgi:VanZ family protein